MTCYIVVTELYFGICHNGNKIPCFTNKEEAHKCAEYISSTYNYETFVLETKIENIFEPPNESNANEII